MMSENDVMRDDWRFVPMYEEFQSMRGMTLTIPSDLMSVLFISEATSDEEWFDTLIHELKHVVENISEFYQVEPSSEPAAYMQGEIGRQLFPMIMRKVCKCKEEGL